MERSFRPRPRNVEPWLYPMCLVQVPKPSEHWWVAWYLPDLDSAIQVQQVLYEHRVTLDPSREPELAAQLSQRKQDLALTMYERLGSMAMGSDMDDASGPVWLLMGPHATTLPYRQVQRYLPVADAAFLSQMVEVTQHARQNPDLQQALQDYRDYHQWTKRQTNLTKVLVPPMLTTRTTSVSQDQGDSATVVTNASGALEESPVVETTEPTIGKRKDSRARSKSHSRPSKRLKKPPKKSSPQSEARSSVTVNTPSPSNQHDPVTPRHESKSTTPEEENSASKFNHQALVEANGYRRASLRSARTFGRRRVFPTIDQEVSPVARRESPSKDSDRTKNVSNESQVEEQSKMGQCSVMEKEDCQQQRQIPQQQRQEQEPARSQDGDKPSDTNNLEQPRDPVTPLNESKSTLPAEENSASKSNHQALVEANGYRRASLRSARTFGRRRVFPIIEQEVSPVARRESPRNDSDRTKNVSDESQVEEQSTMGRCSVMEKEDCQQQQQQQEPEPSQEGDNSCDNNNLEQPQPQEAPQEIHLEPIPLVNLPGVTVREKLDSCLNALRKENEGIVPCHKIHTAQQAILDFFQSVVHSKGATGPNNTLPVLHVCGAPGSGKSMTVDICSRMFIEAFTNDSDPWEVPPRFSFINCSHLQNVSKQDALASTLRYAETTESNLKRPWNIDESKRPTIIFILDEIDYLVAKHAKGTKSEQYIQKMLEWASSPQYMVGLLGISNSVENEKATRLVDLGFPHANKVVFRTYDEADLTRIALTKIGTSVVDEKAIEFLSKKVAGASGDARKFLEILSRSIASAKEELSEATLNALHDKPVIKVPHFMKTFKSSTMKYKDLVEASPAHEKLILCVCTHLARTIGSRPLTLARLLWICQQVFDALDLTSVSELTSVLERLLDSGLLKWTFTRDDKIRFDTQLEDVESAVEEVLLSQNFYRTIFEKLDRLNVAQCTD